MRSEIVMAGMLVAACGGDGNGPPALVAVEPARVSTLIDTSVRIDGHNFFVAMRADLGGGAVEVDDSVGVALDGLRLEEVHRIDDATLEVVIPAGTAIGVYDVVVTLGNGGSVRSPDALTVVDDPVGLPLTIEDAPGGAGTAIPARFLNAGDVMPLHAVVRHDGRFVADVAVAWSVDGDIGVLSSGGPSTTTVFEARRIGSGLVRAAHASGVRTSTGALAVTAGASAALVIVDAAGAEVGDLAITTDDAPVLRVEHRDAFGNRTGDTTATWAVFGAIGNVGAGARDEAGFDPVRAGQGTITATGPLGVDSTGSIVVIAGRAAALEVAPVTLTRSADDAPLTFTATAIDADANPTADLGALTWMVASGPIGRLDPGGTFDPAAAGTGTVAVQSSYGPRATSGAVTVTPGRLASLAIVPPTYNGTAGDPPFWFAATGSDADGNATSDLGTLAWMIADGPIRQLDPSTGRLLPSRAGVGHLTVSSSHGPFATSGDITILGSAHLDASLTAPARLSAGQTFVVSMIVASNGAADAVAVAPSALVPSGGLLLVAGPTPASADVPVGGAASFQWTWQATATGAAVLEGTASGIDAVWGTTVTSAAASAAVGVETPAALAASITLPARAALQAAFTVSMVVTNSGQAAATLVVPSALVLAGSGDALLTSGPSPGLASVPAGGQTSFDWTYRAIASGTVTLSGSAAGQDGNSGAAVATNVVSSAPLIIDEVALVSADPFGDGSRFAFVFGHAGKVYVGPNRTGTAVVRFEPDGTAGESVGFAFARDSNNNSSSNGSSSPFPSIGGTGCIANTAACGPDNENGRGLFAAGTIAGTDWLFAGGARSGGDLDYVYASRSSGAVLGFAYVDLSQLLGGATRGISAMHAMGDRVYLGFPDTGGSRPYLIALVSLPSGPGIDAQFDIDAFDLDADDMPGMQPTALAMIDTIGDLGGRLYIASAGAWWRSTTSIPRAYQANPGDWAPCTPSLSAYTSMVSRTTTKTADLEPADKAVPQMATFGGRLFLGRNTTDGPQLWMCIPATTGDVAGCDPGDWQLVAANASGNTRLSQLGDADNTTIALVAATSSHLYVGYDNAVDGLVLHRTAVVAPVAADFGAPLGSPGLGSPARTRILSGAVIADDLYLVAGGAAIAASVWKIAD